MGLPRSVRCDDWSAGVGEIRCGGIYPNTMMTDNNKSAVRNIDRRDGRNSTHGSVLSFLGESFFCGIREAWHDAHQYRLGIQTK